MRVALCLSGSMRGYQKSFDILKSTLIEQFDPDIFVYAWSTVDKQKARNRANKYNGFFIDGNDPVLLNGDALNADLIEKYKPVDIVLEDMTPEYFDTIGEVSRPLAFREGKMERWSRYNIAMSYAIYMCNELKRKQETKNQQRYDLVIKARTDIRFTKIPDFVLKERTTLWYYPKDHNKSHVVSDKFAFANSNVMDYYCSVYKKMTEYWKGGNIRTPEGYYMMSEMMLKHHFNISDIPVKSFGDEYYDADRARNIREMGSKIHA